MWRFHTPKSGRFDQSGQSLNENPVVRHFAFKSLVPFQSWELPSRDDQTFTLIDDARVYADLQALTCSPALDLRMMVRPLTCGMDSHEDTGGITPVPGLYTLGPGRWLGCACIVNPFERCLRTRVLIVPRKQAQQLLEVLINLGLNLLVDGGSLRLVPIDVFQTFGDVQCQFGLCDLGVPLCSINVVSE